MLKQKELELFSRWKTERGYKYFISDGILDEIEWNKQEYNYFVASIGGKQVPVVSFYHPQMRGSHDKFMRHYKEMIEIGKILKAKYSQI